MELIRTEEFTHPRKVAYVAQGQNLQVADGQELSICVFPGEAPIFCQGPPEGKRWDVYINLSVIERDE